MKVGVTGAGGVLGAVLMTELHKTHPEWVVRGLDKTKRHGSDPSIVIGDVTNLNDLLPFFQDLDTVIHLAAIPRPGLVPDDELFHVNVEGTFRMFEAAVQAGIRRVILASSTAVLGTDWGRRDRPPQYLPFDEGHPLEPEDVYGLSKVIAESIARSYHVRANLEVAVLRPGWILTPQELKNLKAAGGALPRGIHHYAYIDVRDAAVAFRKAIEIKGLTYETMFISADDSTLREPLSIVLPREAPQVGTIAQHLRGDLPGLSNARAKNLLAWRPRYSWRSAAAADSL